MFGVQLKALKQSIAAANRIADPERAIDAYTDIINEKLRSGNKTYTVAVILFLDDDKCADIYCRRANMYEKLAKRSLFRNNEPQALGYYIKALTDMSRANKASESLDKKNACRKQHRDYEAVINEIEQNIKTAIPSVSRKRGLETSSDMGSTVFEKKPSSNYHLRNTRMWNPKIDYEEKVDRLEDERLGNNPKRNRS
ncbi:MAG: hypothetical protein WCR08_00725 [Gammaproteobacteria bacterium]